MDAIFVNLDIFLSMFLTNDKINGSNNLVLVTDSVNTELILLFILGNFFCKCI